MGANKFATIVHKNTNQLTLILIYVALEWALISMLLLNALFSYLILRFSQFFGLQTPCVFCSRIDHVFDPKQKKKKNKNFHTDLLCKAHITEVSQMGPCCFSDSCFSKIIDTERENCETVTSTKKGNSIIHINERSDEFEELKLVVGRIDSSITSETNSKMKAPVDGDAMKLGIAVEEDQSRNQTDNKIEECDDDHNLDKFAVFECLENESYNNTLFFQTKTCDFVSQQTGSDALITGGEGYQMPMNESEDDVSIGTEIPDIESVDEFHHQAARIKEDDHGIKQVDEDVVELKTISIDAVNHQYTLGLELNDMVKDKIPNTPSSIESIHHLYKNLLIEKKESGTVDSFDGSVTSEFEEGEIMSIEHLISTLKAKRKVLDDLYTELEEERSANAIAANQTMAMINRLQEEKAAMQMEALHYQRMMEEQSRYDQEALEYLHELTMRREKEKLELEKELEVYRKRVFEIEGKGNLSKVEKGSESASFSSSNCGDTDGLSIEDSGEDNFHQENGDRNTPVKAILHLDESSGRFEEERLFIMHQLKLLENKLVAQADDDEEEEHFETVEHIVHIYKTNGNHLEKQNESAYGFCKEVNGKHEIGKRIIGMKAKRLLPLFQAVEYGQMTEYEHGTQNGVPIDRLQHSVSESIEYEKRNPDIEEEYDRLYERLQALEADKEFRYLRQ